MRLPARSGARALLWITPLVLLTRAVSASEGGSYPRLCGDACRNTFGTVRFSDEESPPPTGGRFCGGGMLIESLYLCLRVHGCGGDDSPLLEGLNQACLDTETGEGQLPAYEDVMDRWTDEQIEGVRRFNNSVGEGKGRVFDAVAVPEDKFFHIWWRTLVSGAAGGGWDKADGSGRMIPSTSTGITTSMGAYMRLRTTA